MKISRPSPRSPQSQQSRCLAPKERALYRRCTIKISPEHNVISITTNGFITNSTPVQISVHLRSPDYT